MFWLTLFQLSVPIINEKYEEEKEEEAAVGLRYIDDV